MFYIIVHVDSNVISVKQFILKWKWAYLYIHNLMPLSMRYLTVGRTVAGLSFQVVRRWLWIVIENNTFL